MAHSDLHEHSPAASVFRAKASLGDYLDLLFWIFCLKELKSDYLTT